MPLKPLVFQPGINRDVTRYIAEAGWYDCDKIRFRQGIPEKIGGWRRTSSEKFKGVARSLFVWNNNGGAEYVSVGTNLKFYVEFGGVYFDVTPIRATNSAIDAISATAGSITLTISDANHGAVRNDFVTISGAVSLGGNVAASVLNKEHQITTVVDANTYQITLDIPATSADTGNGGSISLEYQINVGPEVVSAVSGWGAGAWGEGSWGESAQSFEKLRLWHQDNFGEDLFLGPSGGALYYWDASNSTSNRAVRVDSLPGASNVPLMQNYLLVSDIFRFAFVFGTNPFGSSDLDSMALRWSDQEDITEWTPRATNQAGGLRLSRGSEIVTALQARQEILVFTDSALYSLQYLGAPAVWGADLLGSNTTIAGPNARVYANGVAYWMGANNFYRYDGRVTPLPCTVLRYVFTDINRDQSRQIFAGTVERFNEIWWFYCSSGSTKVDRYVIYNYLEDSWAYGTMARTAWADSSLLDFPIAAGYNNNVIEHENGVDDNETDVSKPINAYIQSGDFDIEDGDRIMFISRCLPDIGFLGSEATNPAVTMSFLPRYSAGGVPLDPASVGNINEDEVVRSSAVPVTQFTPQIDVRVRGRQMALRVESNTLGTQWSLGKPRIDMRPDGRR